MVNVKLVSSTLKMFPPRKDPNVKLTFATEGRSINCFSYQNLGVRVKALAENNDDRKLEVVGRA